MGSFGSRHSLVPSLFALGIQEGGDIGRGASMLHHDWRFNNAAERKDETGVKKKNRGCMHASRRVLSLNTHVHAACTSACEPTDTPVICTNSFIQTSGAVPWAPIHSRGRSSVWLAKLHKGQGSRHGAFI